MIYLLEEQSCQISSRSDLKRRSLIGLVNMQYGKLKERWAKFIPKFSQLSLSVGLKAVQSVVVNDCNNSVYKANYVRLQCLHR